LGELSSAKNKAAIQTCHPVFLAVPSREGPDGTSDLSAIEEVVSWVKPTVRLKSTVPPGTADRLTAAAGKNIGFSHEYVGGTKWHPWKWIETHRFVTVGGEKAVCDSAVRAYQEYLGPLVHYHITSARTAELCKYMENTFLATQVAFVNQFYDLANAFGVNYTERREIWLADERTGRSHTIETEERRYRGRCLPKEMAALIHGDKGVGSALLLEGVDRFNDEVCGSPDEKPAKISPTPAS